MTENSYAHTLAEVVVRLGANVQPGQIVAVSSEPGKEHLARAIATAAYRAGARFVDLSMFDVHFKRARALNADPNTLDFVPPWYGQRIRALGENRAATIALTGPVAPHLMADVDPKLLGRDVLPSVRESAEVINARLINWTAAPCPTAGWAQLVHPDLDPDKALEMLWREIAHVCRLDEPDPIAAWNARLDHLIEVTGKLDALGLDAVRLEGPGTDVTIGLLGGSRWQAARVATVDGIVHVPNVPTEEVFTTPDPARVEGHVTSTKPLFTSGAVIEGLRVEFQSGRAVSVDADQGAGTVKALTERDDGAARLGEVALVDREGRIGQLGTVFFDTLLDENAASHIALGSGLEFAVEGEDQERVNRSGIHVDFMIGSDEVAVTGITHDGTEVPLLRGGVWQV
jgi:aminopeptidase